jgi:hypothetical protein
MKIIISIFILFILIIVFIILNFVIKESRIGYKVKKFKPLLKPKQEPKQKQEPKNKAVL